MSNEFTDLYEICRYYSSSKPIALQDSIFREPSLETPCLISDGTRTHFDIRESKCNASSTMSKCFLCFNEQLAHARNGRNTSDELKLASGVSKSSIRYVSTSPEGWIGFASKSGRRREDSVKGFGQGRPVEREWGGGWCSQWSAHLADPTSLTSLMIYVELQAP